MRRNGGAPGFGHAASTWATNAAASTPRRRARCLWWRVVPPHTPQSASCGWLSSERQAVEPHRASFAQPLRLLAAVEERRGVGLTAHSPSSPSRDARRGTCAAPVRRGGSGGGGAEPDVPLTGRTHGTAAVCCPSCSRWCAGWPHTNRAWCRCRCSRRRQRVAVAVPAPVVRRAPAVGASTCLSHPSIEQRRGGRWALTSPTPGAAAARRHFPKQR